MKISTKTRYGMRFMIDLAKNRGNGCVALKDVAQRQGVSKKYLEQIVSPLVSAGLLHVTRGYQGGYELARAPKDITVADIVEVTEDGLGLIDCTSGLFPCERSEGCLSQGIWMGLEQRIRTYLEDISLQDILDRNLGA